MYPALDIYPSVAQSVPSAKEIITSQPTPSSHRQPVQRSSGVVQVPPVRLPVTYPSFDLCEPRTIYMFLLQPLKYFPLDPPAYPVFDLYPAPPSRTDYKSSKSISIRLHAEYPMLNICSLFSMRVYIEIIDVVMILDHAVYPHFNIYPSPDAPSPDAPSPDAEVQSPVPGVNIALDARYPILRLCASLSSIVTRNSSNRQPRSSYLPAL